MVVVSTRDFRANQTKFLGMANDGEDVVLKSRALGSFRLIPVGTNDKVQVGERDLMLGIRNALIEFKEHLEGKRKLESVDTLIDELRNRTNQ